MRFLIYNSTAWSSNRSMKEILPLLNDNFNESEIYIQHNKNYISVNGHELLFRSGDKRRLSGLYYDYFLTDSLAVDMMLNTMYKGDCKKPQLNNYDELIKVLKDICGVC